VDDSTVPGIGDEDLALRVHRDPQRKPERAAAVEPELGPKRAGRGDPMTHVKMPAYGVSLTQMFLPALSAAGVVV
jgi:hypothetical protein